MSSLPYPTLQSIPLEAISLQRPESLQFVYTRFPLVTELAESIRQVGLLHPLLLLQQREEGAYQILCGYRRLLACQLVGYSPLPALCYASGTLSAEKALWMSLQEDRACRQYTPLEKGVVLQKFHELLGYTLEKLVAEIAPFLFLPPTIPVVERYLIFPTLDMSLQRSLHEGSLSPEQMGLLLSLTSAERQLFFVRVIEPCAPTLNETREILGCLLDLKATLHCGLPAILEQPELAAVLEDAQLHKRKRCQLLRHRLRLLRYPLLTSQETLFKKTLHSLSLPSKVEISHPPFFEGSALTITLRPDSAQELQAMFSSLEQTGQQEQWHSLFAILQGEKIRVVGEE